MNFFSKRTLSIVSKCFVTFIALITFNITMAKAQKTDYSGIWKLNELNTDFGNLTKRSGYVILKVIQNDQSIRIERFYDDDAGQRRSYTEELPFDGRSVESMIDKTHKKAHITWSSDNKILTQLADYTNPGEDEEIIGSKGTQVWMLSANGKTLTCNYTSQDDAGSYHANYVYNKSE
jgi:hypothetical protein